MLGELLYATQSTFAVTITVPIAVTCTASPRVRESTPPATPHLTAPHLASPHPTTSCRDGRDGHIRCLIQVRSKTGPGAGSTDSTQSAIIPPIEVNEMVRRRYNEFLRLDHDLHTG